ncbi:helix-turn-helix domain-containing protein, partial [Dolichospermum sp. ST_sed2]|nr:helix-turn-helix domain-containing protein [Dolichospermum sp. ST_sed2]
MNVKELIKKFGGQSVLAEKLGIGQSAVAYWVKKNAIPSKWHSQLLSLAGSLNVDILATDLLAVDLSDRGLSKVVTKSSTQAAQQP